MSKRNERYWTAFVDHLNQRGSQFQTGEAYSKHYLTFTIATGFAVRARQSVKGEQISAQIVLRSVRAQDHFDVLREHRAEVETEFGEELLWWEHDKDKQVGLRKINTDPTDENDWHHQHEWLATTLERLIEVFQPRIQRISS